MQLEHRVLVCAVGFSYCRTSSGWVINKAIARCGCSMKARVGIKNFAKFNFESIYYYILDHRGAKKTSCRLEAHGGNRRRRLPTLAVSALERIIVSVNWQPTLSIVVCSVATCLRTVSLQLRSRLVLRSGIRRGTGSGSAQCF